MSQGKRASGETEKVLDSERREEFQEVMVEGTIGDFLAFWLQRDLLSSENARVFYRYYFSYKEQFSSYIKKYYEEQTREVQRVLKDFEAPRVLEVGCGCGTESLWLSNLGGKVTAIDIAEEKIRVARERKEIIETCLGESLDCEFKRGSLLEMEEEEAFDIIWMEQTFHHLEPRGEVVEKIARILKVGGYVVISETNALNPLMQLQMFWVRGWPKVFEYTDSKGEVHLVGDERILRAKKLKRSLANCGIEPLSLRYFRCLPNYSWPSFITSIEKMIPQWLPFFFTHYNYLGQKKE